MERPPRASLCRRILVRIGAVIWIPGILWGVCLGAWVSVLGGLALIGALRYARGCSGLVLGGALLGLVGIVAPIEVALSIDRIGARARAGELSLREQLGVYGFNLVFGAASVGAGFSGFGIETLSLALPSSWAGACPPERLARYGADLPRAYAGHVPRLRSWSSELPMRSPRIRGVVSRWAQALPGGAPEGVRYPLGPTGPFTWPASAYTSIHEANQVPIALNTPTTRMSGEAVRVGDRWRLELVVDLAVAYPERSTLQLGPIALEEGMWHDARLLLQPYCGEYRWVTWSDDPGLDDPDPVRGPAERITTWVLRQAGAAYR